MLVGPAVDVVVAPEVVVVTSAVELEVDVELVGPPRRATGLVPPWLHAARTADATTIVDARRIPMERQASRRT